MNKNIVIAVGVLALVGAGAYMMMGKTPEPVMEKQPESANGVMEKSGTQSGEGMEQDAAKIGATGEVKTFLVDGSSFKFSVTEMKVKKGDTVKIVFTNTEGFHDWVIDEFEARTKQIAAGQSETVEFVANRAGTFEYYCSVGAHRANGMVGNLIVTE